MKQLIIEASVRSIGLVTQFINSELEAQNCSPRAQVKIDVAIDEIFGNIARYAYAEGKGSVTVQFDVKDGFAEISFIDDGVPFNPLEIDEPDISLAAEDRDIGGLGIFLVKKTMDSVEYERKDNQNILRLTKRI